MKKQFLGTCRGLLCGLGVWAMLGFSGADSVHGQSGLRESLERLDVDGDGRIEPEEITPLARPYLERIATARRMSLDRDNRIDEWQEAARIYFALQNGVADRTVEPERKGGVMPFGLEPDEPVVPEFGLAEVRYPYTQEDLEGADRTLRRNDSNRDGIISRQEAIDGRWTHRDPFETDFDGNEQLSRLELAQRYARRRMLSGDAGELVKRAQRIGNGIRPSGGDDTRRDDDGSRWWRRGSDYYLTGSVMGRFDLNRDGRLDSTEAKNLGVSFGRIDVDRDGELSRDEVYGYLQQQQNEAGDVTAGLPGWFYELDLNRDGQVAMEEYADDWTPEKFAEFSSLDTNDDGLLTESEVVESKAITGGTYENSIAEVLPPRKTVISEIEVVDDILIADLNLELSITHTSVGYLDGFLTGPDGQRIELFTEVGGSGDHFVGTVFDDQSDTPIVKGRTPFEGRFMPEGLMRREPGLGYFTGKSAKGIWQLVIRGSRSERFGMLHNWSLNFRATEVDVTSGQRSTATPPSDSANAPDEPATEEVRGDERERKLELKENFGQAYAEKMKARQAEGGAEKRPTPIWGEGEKPTLTKEEWAELIRQKREDKESEGKKPKTRKE